MSDRHVETLKKRSDNLLLVECTHFKCLILRKLAIIKSFLIIPMKGGRTLPSYRRVPGTLFHLVPSTPDANIKFPILELSINR